MREEFDEIDEMLDGPVDFVYIGKIPEALRVLCIFTFIGTRLILIKDYYLLIWYLAASDAVDVTNIIAQSEIARSPSQGLG